MGSLRVLPSQIANMIAAGEVVLRPASVVKELMENAIDAGADSITVNITDAGRTLIQVIDNGCGMSPADALLCFERHATSKIARASDLEDILTYGFRGEALASIAAVAEVTLRTRRSSDETAVQVRISGGNPAVSSSVAAPVGSNFAVRNLFYNTPARRRFLKSDNVEFKHIVEEFTRVAVTRPQCAFTLNHNGKDVYVLRKDKSLKFRVTGLLGSSLASDVIDIDIPSERAHITGFAGRPQTARKTRMNQYFFVNGRFFRSGYLHKAVMKAYENLIPEGTAPSYLLFFEVDPHSVDVNIHPAKTEVKFENESLLFEILSNGVRLAISRSSIGASINFDTEGAVELPQISSSFEEYNAIEMPGIDFDPSYNPFSPEQGPAPASPYPKYNPVTSSRQAGSPAAGRNPGGSAPYSRSQSDYSALFEESGMNSASGRMLVVRGKYIITPSASGLMVVHIRRATERILYERTLNALGGSPARAGQRALFPTEINIGVQNRLIIDEHAPALRSIGFDFKPVAEDSLSVEAVPDGYSSAPEVLRDTFCSLAQTLSDEPAAALPELMNQQLAARIAAAGSRGTDNIATALQAQRLIDTLFECSNAELTPGGLRTVAIFSIEEIDKLF